MQENGHLICGIRIIYNSTNHTYDEFDSNGNRINRNLETILLNLSDKLSIFLEMYDIVPKKLNL